MKQKRKPIDSKLLKNWRFKMYDTTYMTIAEKTGLSENTVANSIRMGKATQTTINLLTIYFNEMEVTA